MPDLGEVIITARDLVAPWLPTNAFYNDADYPALAEHLDQSPAGINWVSQTSGFGSDQINTSGYSSAFGLWVIAGALGALSTSPDRVVWTPRTTGITSTVQGVGSSPSEFVLVGGSGKIARSSNGGLSWSVRSNPFGTSTVYDVFYADGIFVAVGGDGTVDGVIATSTNGLSWTQRTSNADFVLKSVGYGDGLWVAVGNNNELVTSPDGITWTPRTVDFGNSTMANVCYGNGIWVAVGSAGRLYTSTNGISWVTRDSKFGTTQIEGLDFNPAGEGLWIISGASSKIATSPDGINWTVRSVSFGSTTVWTVAAGPTTEWVAAGNNGGLGTTQGPPLGEFWVPPVNNVPLFNSYIYSGA